MISKEKFLKMKHHTAIVVDNELKKPDSHRAKEMDNIWNSYSCLRVLLPQDSAGTFDLGGGGALPG